MNTLDHVVIITIVNVKTKEVKAVWLDYPEQVAEIEQSLFYDEVMFVNNLMDGMGAE